MQVVCKVSEPTLLAPRKKYGQAFQSKNKDLPAYAKTDLCDFRSKSHSAVNAMHLRSISPTYMRCQERKKKQIE